MRYNTAGVSANNVIKNSAFYYLAAAGVRINNPTYSADAFSLPKGSPGFGFVIFDPNQAGCTNPVLKPPVVSPTFPTKLFNPATDF